MPNDREHDSPKRNKKKKKKAQYMYVGVCRLFDWDVHQLKFLKTKKAKEC